MCKENVYAKMENLKSQICRRKRRPQSHNLMLCRLIISNSHFLLQFLKFEDIFYARKFKDSIQKFFKEIDVTQTYSSENKASLRLGLDTVHDREKLLEDFFRILLTDVSTCFW